MGQYFRHLTSLHVSASPITDDPLTVYTGPCPKKYVSSKFWQAHALTQHRRTQHEVVQPLYYSCNMLYVLKLCSFYTKHDLSSVQFLHLHIDHVFHCYSLPNNITFVLNKFAAKFNSTKKHTAILGTPNFFGYFHYTLMTL